MLTLRAQLDFRIAVCLLYLPFQCGFPHYVSGDGAGNWPFDFTSPQIKRNHTLLLPLRGLTYIWTHPRAREDREWAQSHVGPYVKGTSRSLGQV